MAERLQKVMAAAGVASRRASEELIAEGRVTVNGEVAELGCKVDPTATTSASTGSGSPPTPTASTCC